MNFLEKKKEDILSDLNSMSSKEFYEEYIMCTRIWYFERVLLQDSVEEIDDFKKIISEEFKIERHDSHLVGSGKLGFSLAPNKKFKSFKLEESEGQVLSDLDIAIVSPELFKVTWENLKEYKYEQMISEYKVLSSSVFRGFINDKNLFQQLGLNTNAINHIDRCSIRLRDHFDIIHPINYRIYNSWRDLELYTLSGIEKCKGGNLKK
ncbi:MULTISPECIES: hypothetical protein [unclassified Enterococcus]|uniref:hypothetical protein n=1 Tax=unclassified Enterococcus TaxID=2608891 RepID=UPI001CE11796|nr:MULTISPECIES: hypothetical protein [unclassified Enterococcus]MCA5011777.1 hypothetical protein [Enterococcus sp. S23]MCA5014781.1 hypothetical protein [Enterococcus sp. S22(2020)]